MPNTGTPSPASTPQLMLENNYRQLQEWGQRQEQELQSLGLDDEMYAEKLGKLQTDFDKRRANIETNMNTVRQTQNLIDLGIINETEGEEIKWRAVVGEEIAGRMFPKPESGPGFYRRPFTVGQLKDFQPTIKARFKAAKVDIPDEYYDRPTYESLLRQYKAWQIEIGYHGGLSNAEQNQADEKWDAWAKNTYPKTAWYPQARKEIRALRAKGPITRGFTDRFRGTPTGPREAGDPLKDNIIANLPKQRQPAPEPQPEDKPARINIRNKKTGKRMFSDDGGRTWQNVK